MFPRYGHGVGRMGAKPAGPNQCIKDPEIKEPVAPLALTPQGTPRHTTGPTPGWLQLDRRRARDVGSWLSESTEKFITLGEYLVRCGSSTHPHYARVRAEVELLGGSPSPHMRIIASAGVARGDTRPTGVTSLAGATGVWFVRRGPLLKGHLLKHRLVRQDL